ncbi:MAG: 50S ribosomal protein L1 [Patescibacteria group bacterium]
MPHSKRYTELTKLVEPKKLYSPVDAIELVKKTASTKFDGTVELHVRLGIDVKKSDQTVRYTIVMPHAAGKTKKVAAFVPGDKEKDATDAGADLVGSEELIEKLAASGKIDFDVAVATPDMMPKLAKLAKILGPKGIMPNPKTETVGTNVKKMIEELKKGKITVKNDSTGNLHQAIGKASNPSSDLLDNLNAVLNAIRKAKPASAKGSYMKTVVITSTMGPAIHLDVSSV